MTAPTALRPAFTLFLVGLVLATGCATKEPPVADEPSGVQIAPEQPKLGGTSTPTAPVTITSGPRAADREPKPDGAVGQTLVGAQRAHLGPRDRSINSLAFTPDGRW